MTVVTFKYDEDGLLKGFCASGHAGFRKRGSDIVCAAVSILTVNFVNSVDKLTDAHYKGEQDEKKGYLNIDVIEYNRSDIQLLFNSLKLGLEEISKNYSKYLQIDK